ncbi:MAG: hypothetical protein GWM98_08450 [Nitrospinaceae bacterium]|nr:hypothetical protein [Nitrospinaceae bacterium]NIR54524.1 hypothetical protein [Nitrospinaceae bacterium]NIS84943.1 hypothetical protein [Nitrospinaceae bacterium]NIT81757.1 hypothetical protein [Nitrospinaceae bacterium]NIU44026.1 hypothetical protein [Nitrospinaceae bacterium]
MLKKNKVNFVYRSRLGRKAKPSNSVVVLDTLGELAKVYSIADVTFVGSSLVAPGGGHNLLEPVSQGKCVIHGPYVENVQKIASELKHAGLAFIAPDAQGIASTVMRLLGKNTDRSKFISAAGGYIQSQRGTATEIAKYIVTLTSK